MTDRAAAKSAMRRDAGRRRAALAAASEGAAADLARLALISLAVKPGTVVAGYCPIGDEIDPMPLLTALAERAICALPSMSEGPVLSFRRWQPRMKLVAGRYGIPAPPLDSPLVFPDILLAPMLAFDRSGHRLGYGGGHYDATIAALRAERTILAAGLAYAGQEVDSVPAEAWDQRLDLIVTEREFIRCAPLETRR